MKYSFPNLFSDRSGFTDFNPTMAEPPNQTHPSPQQPLHQIDADEDDDNVKQLKQCSSLYLSLQVLYPTIYI
jgi:hypothetical protein